MCFWNHHHWYIFEPVQLTSGMIVVPIYFYQIKGHFFSKCAMPMLEEYEEDKIIISLPGTLNFESEILQTVSVSDFVCKYTEICGSRKQLLSTHCECILHGIYLI